MVDLKTTWELKGIYQEACASEGPCPYFFGRNKEGGCRYFAVFTINEGVVNGVDLSGITLVYVGDLPYATFHEVVEKGSKGAIYISNKTSPEQRDIMDVLALNSLGGAMMNSVLGVQYVKIDTESGENSIHVKMPTGEMKMQLTKSKNGHPIGLENVTLPFLTKVKAAHTSFWNWSDYDRSYSYTDRCGTWANFSFKSES